MPFFSKDRTPIAIADPLCYPEVPYLEAKAILAAHEFIVSQGDRATETELDRILSRMEPFARELLASAAVLVAKRCAGVEPPSGQNSITGTVHGVVVQARDMGPVDLRG